MAKHIDIELTAHSSEDTWAWRVVNAKQPRGKMLSSIVPDGVKVGDVLHAEIESGLDGIEIVSAVKADLPEDSDSNSNRIVILGTQRKHHPRYLDYAETIETSGDNDTLASSPKSSRNREAQGKGSSSRQGGTREQHRTRSNDAKGDHDKGRAGTISARAGMRGGEHASDRGDMGRRHDPIRRSLSTKFRDAALAQLRPEQLPVAEELLRGGIPAVRKQIDRQNAAAKRNNAPLIAVDPLLAMAEELLPAINLAHWKDRAVTARSLGSDTPLYELRSIVSASSNVDLDGDASEMAVALKEALHSRVEALRTRWEEQIDHKISKGDIVEALELSSAPPDRGFKLPSNLATKLSEAASSALSSGKTEQEWLTIVNAVVASPIRRNVKPVALPENSGSGLRTQLYKIAGLVPGISKLIGLPMPPPPMALKR
ncbi:MAG: hypothetical protein ACYDGY_06950 [Acidimicrobiales bacterium]